MKGCCLGIASNDAIVANDDTLFRLMSLTFVLTEEPGT